MNTELVVKVAKLCDKEDFDKIKIPNKLDENAGFDIFPYFKEESLTILPGETVKIGTGIGTAFSSGYVAILEERSSTGALGIGQRGGVMDSGYRGEWIVTVTNHNNKSIIIHKNIDSLSEKEKEDNIVLPYSKAICQAVFHKIPDVKVKEISKEELLGIPSIRGEGAFGSTDAV